jgi:hypothetical protein
VAVIHGVMNSVITTIPVGIWPLAFAWNSVQNRTYLANFAGSSISVIRDMTGIEEDMEITTPSARNNVVVYPNPTTASFTIHSSAPMESIRIYDTLGKLLKIEEVSKSEIEKSISMKNMSAGVYFVMVNAADTEFIEKILVTE